MAHAIDFTASADYRDHWGDAAEDADDPAKMKLRLQAVSGC
jgi:hypothetical protein